MNYAFKDIGKSLAVQIQPLYILITASTSQPINNGGVIRIM